MFASLQTQLGDPVQRLKAIAEANLVAKQHSSAIGASLLQDWSQFAAPAVFGVAMRLYASTRLTESMPVHNLVVSNVPGPQVPLYMLGCEVKAMYPLGPIFHSSGLNITVMSLCGKLDVGLISMPGIAAGSVGDGRRVRGGDGRTACGRQVAVRRRPLTRHSVRSGSIVLSWACLAATRSRARC